MPLNKGDFSQIKLLKILKEMNFKGPMALQCYGIKGNRYENLKDSITAWNNLIKQINKEN